jgi:protein deglycase
LENFMPKVLVTLADGSEEIEAVTVIDVLRRAKIEVCVASVMPKRKQIKASRGVLIEADELLPSCLELTWDMIVLPGGMPGSQHLSDCVPLIQKLRQQLVEGRWVAAICAAPAVVLARHKLIPDAVATCFPAAQAELQENIRQLSQQHLVIDKTLITSQGPGTAMDFALHLVATLSDVAQAEEIARAMVYEWAYKTPINTH